MAKKAVQKGVTLPVHEPTEENKVFSHLMYILFLISGAIAAYYTYNMFTFNKSVDFMPVKALVMLGWAFIFKTFGHRIHHPYH